jgi:hypothetical protein
MSLARLSSALSFCIVALRLIYLLATRIFAWLGLTSRDSTAKDVEIFILRHQFSVAQRRDPHLARKLTWADRAWLTLPAGLRPAGRSRSIRLIGTPCRRRPAGRMGCRHAQVRECR